MSGDWHNTVGFTLLIAIGIVVIPIVLCVAAAFLLP